MGKPVKRQRERQRIADKILNGELLTDADVAWYEREAQKIHDNYRWSPLTHETSQKAREVRKRVNAAKAAGRLEGIEEGTKAAIKHMSADAVGVLHIAMQKLADEAVLKDADGNPTGEIDTAAINVATLRMAMSAANSVLDRSEGKATTKIEGTVQHEHTFWQEIASQGLLDQ